MTDPNPAATERHFLAWLTHQAGEPGDPGDLARGHLEGVLNLSWHASKEISAVQASYWMARARFDRQLALGLVRPDGSGDITGGQATTAAGRKPSEQPRRGDDKRHHDRRQNGLRFG